MCVRTCACGCGCRCAIAFRRRPRVLGGVTTFLSLEWYCHWQSQGANLLRVQILARAIFFDGVLEVFSYISLLRVFAAALEDE